MEENRRRKIWKIVAIVAVVVVVLLVAAISLIPVLVDKEDLKAQLEEGLEESTGVEFEIEELALDPTFGQGLQVHLNTNTIKDMDGDPLGSIGNITVQIRYLPLLTERVPVIGKIHLDDVYIPVRERSLFTELDLKLDQPEPEGFLKPAELRNTEILLTDYLIEDFETPAAVDTLVPKAQQFRIQGDKISIKHLRSNRPASLLGDMRLYFTPESPEEGIGANPVPPDSLLVGKLRLFGEVSRAVFEDEHQFTISDLRRIELAMDSEKLPFKLLYRHLKGDVATGSMESGWLNLTLAQALALQLSDTLALPVPDALDNVYLAGRANINDEFRLIFKTPNEPEFRFDGNLMLDNVAVARPEGWPNRILHRIHGTIRMAGDVIRMRDIQVYLGNLPLHLQGTYNLATERVNAQLRGNNLRLTSLKRILRDFGVPLTALQGREVTGVVDITANLTGPIRQPAYRGTIQLEQARYQDESQGILVQDVTGRLNFRGRGLETPRIQYGGMLRAGGGQLVTLDENLVVSDFRGQIRLDGAYTVGQAFQLPDLGGAIQVEQARYTDPQTGLTVQDISGQLQLAGDVIRVEGFEGFLDGTRFVAQGTVTPNLAQPAQTAYNIQITGQDIDLQQFRQEVLAEIPQAQTLLSMLQPYQGEADVNLTVATGFEIDGRVQVSQLALRTGVEDYPIRVPSLAILIEDGQITVPRAEVFYGDVALGLEGEFQVGGGYRFRLAAREIPISSLRDNQDLIVMLTGTTLPEIWNTAGSVALDGVITDQAVQVTMDFDNAGLSWRGGAFPVYDINGRLFYKQPTNGVPTIATRDLSLQYGNSPVAVDVDNGQQLELAADGILSPLLVNHFLVSPQSEATPYRQVPFRVAAQGTLAALPNVGGNAQNDLVASVYLDLNPNLKPPAPRVVEDAEAGQDVLSTDETPGLARSAVRQANGDVTLRLEPAQIPQAEPAQAVAPQQTQGSVLSVPQAVDRATAVERDVTVGPEGPVPEDVSGDDAYLTARARFLDDELRLERGLLHLFDAGNLLVEGVVQNLTGDTPPVFQVRAYTMPEVSLTELARQAGETEFFQNAQGTITADLMLLGGGEFGSPQIDGWLAANQVQLPVMTIRELTARADFEGQSATLSVDTFNIPGVEARMIAEAENVFDAPVTLENVEIQGPLLSVASLIDFSNNVIGPVVVQQLAHSFARPRQSGDPTLPFQFRNADVHFDEAIFQNIIITNFNSQLSVYANSFFELTDAELEAAGGTLTGYFSMNPAAENFMTLELNANDVKANALTRALLGVTNQIFGDLDGTVRFTTSGTTDEAMLRNANGTVSMLVEEGRLPAIAKVETLLAAANLIRGGVLNFNLNNLLRSLTIYDDSYFAELSGDLLVANGVLYTENLLSDGEDLDLLIQGSLRMRDGAANMLVTGTMNQEVAGRLGPLGSLSVGSLLGYVPGLGTFGNGRPGLLSYIPGVGYVPGLGGPAGDVNRFRVRLVGELDSPDAIQDFAWLGGSPE